MADQRPAVGSTVKVRVSQHTVYEGRIAGHGEHETIFWLDVHTVNGAPKIAGTYPSPTVCQISEIIGG